MNNISINIGFIILAVIGFYLLISLINNLIVKPSQEIKKLKKWRDEAYTDYMKSEVKNLKLQNEIAKLKSTSNDYLKYKNQYCDDKNKLLENWILKERFIKDLDETKAKADDFANQLEMQSTERDAADFQNKLKVIK